MFPIGVISQQAINPFSSLQVNLMAWYSCETNGSTLIDETGNYPMVNATASKPTVVTGKVGNALDSVGGTRWYYHSSVESEDFNFTTGAFTASIWAQVDVLEGSRNWGPFSRYISGNGWGLNIGPNTGYNWSAQFNGTYLESGETVLTDGTWQLITIWKDPSGNELGIQVDDNAPVTIPHFNLNSAGYTMGLFRYTTRTLQGALDEFAIWDRALIAEERGYLWNGGSGISYADTL